jgi:hypothetical protein
MSNKSYPYDAWVLTPSFKPKQVKFNEPCRYGEHYGDSTESGKVYHHSEIYPDLKSAITAGWGKVEIQQADIDKRQERLDKKKIALTKAYTSKANG